MPDSVTTPDPPIKSATDSPKTLRSKRGRYNPLACDDCKRRKLKCVRSESDVHCQRCLARGLTCKYGRNQLLQSREAAMGDESNNSTQIQKLSDEIAFLRQQVSSLTGSLQQIAEQPKSVSGHSPTTQQSSPSYTTSPSSARVDPKQPQFVGPTRSAFSLRIARTSLNQMGLSGDETQPGSREQSEPASPLEAAPSESKASPKDKDFAFLLDFSNEEVIRLLDLFQDEVESVYPFINSKELAADSDNMLLQVKLFHAGQPLTSSAKASKEDIQLLVLVLATAVVIQTHGKNDMSTRMVNAIESDILSISREAPIHLKDLQLVTLLSIYYFHCDEELLAWRTIGMAVRQSMEMGLHHKSSLEDNFPNPRTRELATRVFWCAYALDRRWSFGTSLSFALNDKDIDPNLPEPGEDYQYLRCMVAHGRLCSKVWDAIPPPGATFQSIPKDIVAFLDFLTQTWLSEIPTNLQLRHPRLGLAPRTQPRVIHRLRALLYLRGNHIRMLIHRHNVISTANIMTDLTSARLVVEIAKDSIQVLVHLNESSDIYASQQNVFNYFLLSALAVIMLAVCHAPTTFAKSCREGFLSATGLVKTFSRESVASRRLWRSIRGIVPGIRTLGLQGEAEIRRQESESARKQVFHAESVVDSAAGLNTGGASMSNYHNLDQTWSMLNFDTDFGTSVPEAFQMSSDLTGLFDAFGQTISNEPLAMANNHFEGQGELGMAAGDMQEIARRFHGLI